jgi:hypothetical protein
MKYFTVCALALLPGCATLTTGTTSRVNVQTVPAGLPALCQAQNGRGSWTLAYTPGDLTVAKSSTALHIHCQTPTAIGDTDLEANGNPMLFGNLVIGGLIGGGIDVASGAAWAYPDHVYVPMHTP